MGRGGGECGPTGAVAVRRAEVAGGREESPEERRRGFLHRGQRVRLLPGVDFTAKKQWEHSRGAALMIPLSLQAELGRSI